MYSSQQSALPNIYFHAAFSCDVIKRSSFDYSRFNFVYKCTMCWTFFIHFLTLKIYTFWYKWFYDWRFISVLLRQFIYTCGTDHKSDIDQQIKSSWKKKDFPWKDLSCNQNWISWSINDIFFANVRHWKWIENKHDWNCGQFMFFPLHLYHFYV